MLPDGYSDVPAGKIAAVVTHLEMMQRPPQRSEQGGRWTLRHVDQPDPDWFREYVDGDSIVVPPRKYFAMGDNRDNSLDSRYWGFVPRENIVGKPLVIYWSYGGKDSYEPNKFKQVLELAKNFFPLTRWERTFKIIR